MSQNLFTAQWTQTQTFYAYIDNQGNIVSQNMQGNQIVGVSIGRYKELEALANEATEKAEKYKKQLIEAGIIKEPLTEQQQIEQLTQQVANLTQIIQNMGANNNEHTKLNQCSNEHTAEQPIKRENPASTATSEPVPTYKGRSVPTNTKS